MREGRQRLEPQPSFVSGGGVVSPCPRPTGQHLVFCFQNTVSSHLFNEGVRLICNYFINYRQQALFSVWLLLQKPSSRCLSVSSQVLNLRCLVIPCCSAGDKMLTTGTRAPHTQGGVCIHYLTPYTGTAPIKWNEQTCMPHILYTTWHQTQELH